MELVTIVAKNYLPYARTLAESVRENAPNRRLTIVILDADIGEVNLGDLARIVTPQELNLDFAEFGRLALFYDVRELCTAIKLDENYTLFTRLKRSLFREVDRTGDHDSSFLVILNPHLFLCCYIQMF